MGSSYYNGFDAVRITAQGIRVPVANETFNVDEIPGGFVATVESDEYGYIDGGDLGVGAGTIVEFSHDTYPETFRRTTAESIDEAALLAVNAVAAYLVENLGTTREAVSAEIWARDVSNPEAVDVRLGIGPAGATVQFPLETQGTAKSLKFYLQPVTSTGEKKHLLYENAEAVEVEIESSSADALARAANTVFAGPTAGADDTPTFRSLVAADIPSLAAVYQPLDATLTALAAQDWAANSIPIGSGANTLAQVSFAANMFPARASSGNLVAKPITDFGLSLVNVANAAAGRSLLATPTIGDAVAGGGTNRVLYENSSQVLAASANLSFDGSVLVHTGSANAVQQKFKAHSTQTANITEWQKSTGVELASIFQDSNGYGGLRLYSLNAPVHGIDIRTDTADAMYVYVAGSTTLGNIIAKTIGGISNYPALDITSYHAPIISASFNGAITFQAGPGVSGSEYIKSDLPVAVGVGAFPTAKLQVRSTSEQARFEYDGLNRMTIAVSSAGAVTLNAVGSGAKFTFSKNVVARIQKRVRSQTDVATLTPDIDAYDAEVLTAQNQNLTIANPTGTPTSCQDLRICITTGGFISYTITWGSKYAGALPTNTPGGGFRHYHDFTYNADLDTWDLILDIEL